MSQRVVFAPEDFIVSRTDLRGIITYANQAIMDVAGYDESELLGRPHSIIRHPDMPRCVFQLLWDTIQTGQEIFAFVKNRCNCGDYSWVLAYVTADMKSTTREIDGYYSVCRVPHDNALRSINDCVPLRLEHPVNETRFVKPHRFYWIPCSPRV